MWVHKGHLPEVCSLDTTLRDTSKGMSVHAEPEGAMLPFCMFGGSLGIYLHNEHPQRAACATLYNIG